MEQLLKILLKNNITPDQFFCMVSLNDQINYPGINYEKECQVLMNKGFVTYDEGYKLASRGKGFLFSVEKLFKKSKVKTEPTPEFVNKIKSYVDLFPIGKQGSQPIRCSAKSIVDRFQWFFSEFDYTWEEVLGATEAYIKACESNGYKYIRTAKNFVKKDENVGARTVSSILADWCESVRNDEVVVPGSKYFGENIV